MNNQTYKTGLELLKNNKNIALLFLISFFILTSFAGTRLYMTDEAVVLDQFYNLIHGSLSLETFKINSNGIYLVFNNNIYGKFSYSLLILSLPVYYFLKTIDLLYGGHLFLLQLWALSGGVIAYLIAVTRKIKYPELFGVISYFVLIAVNMYYFKPINFPRWGEWLSIEFTNILISSFLVILVYLLFRKFFNDKIALFASFFVIFATPISFYAITLKHHTLSLFLTVLAFYFFNKKLEKNNDKYIYYAYLAAGLCVWTRILDGVVLLTALLVTDLVIFKRGIKYMILVSIIIIVSLIPFFTFNYLTLGNPLSVMENTPQTGAMAKMQPGQDVIILNQESTNTEQVKLMKELGFKEKIEPKNHWLNILLASIFLKSQNTFGVFLISPFLIIALGFIIAWIRRKIRLNPMDKFFGLYILLFVPLHKDYLISIIIYTPEMLEYRYFLILYIILIYFALRIDKIRDLIEKNLQTIFILFSIISVLGLIYFIVEFPIPFLNIYYYAALITSISLIALVSTNLLAPNKIPAAVFDKILVFIIGLSLSLASTFLLFYYWVVNMTYMSPSQNFTILPVLQKVMEWMYRIIL